MTLSHTAYTLNNPPERLLWMDLAKCIGIYLMIVGHGPLLAHTYARTIIYSFHMPLFFIISGFFYKKYSFIDTIKRDWIRLLLPYFILNLLGLFLWIITNPSEVDFGNTSSRVYAIMLGLGYQTECFTPVLPPTWFIIALFLDRVIMSFLATKKIGVILFSLLSSVLVWCLTPVYDTLFPIDSALLAFPFFGLGYLLKNVIENLSSIRNKQLVTLSIVVLFLLFIFNKYNNRVDMCLASYGNNIVLFYLGGILGSLLVFIMSISLMKLRCFYNISNHISQYAQGTLLVVGFNLYAIYSVVKIYQLFRHAITPFEGIIIGTVIFFVFYPLILLCKRYFPQAIGVKK